MHAFIFNIQRFSIHDGPGIRTTVFFQGCPLQCVWCHNPEGIPEYLESQHPEESKSKIKKYAATALLDELMKDKAYYDESGGGVTFSGGEPLMQSEFLFHMLKLLRDEGVHTTVDTSGYAPGDVFDKICREADLILFDLKLADNNKHRYYAGTTNSLIHQNLDKLIASKTKYKVRIPLVNELTASDENLDSIASLLRGKGAVEINLLSYHDLGKGKQSASVKKKQNKIKLSAPSAERLQEIHDKFTSYGFTVGLGG